MVLAVNIINCTKKGRFNPTNNLNSDFKKFSEKKNYSLNLFV